MELPNGVKLELQCVGRRDLTLILNVSGRVAVFRFDADLKVYLHREPVDGRKAINGLALLVEQALGLNPFEPALYVFSNRRRDRIKLLLWDRTGFWLMIKRLEADRFAGRKTRRS